MDTGKGCLPGVAMAMAIAIMLVVGVAPAAAATTVDPSLAYATRWGWVTGRQATGTYTPAAKDQGNSTGGLNTVTYYGNGDYQVVFGGLAVGKGGSEGIVHVSPLTNGARNCSIQGWYFDAGNALAGFQCFKANGSPGATPFSITYLAMDETGGHPLAYLMANDRSSPHYTPYPPNSFNSTGATNEVVRLGVGHYRAYLTNLSSHRGTAQVTAMTNKAQLDRFCSVADLNGDGQDMIVEVKCRDLDGHPIDVEWTLTYMNKVYVDGLNGLDSILYLAADQPSTGSYVPPKAYRFSDPSGSVTVTRTGIGAYTATASGAKLGGAATVTAYKGALRHCVIAAIERQTKPQRINVRCFDLSGSPTDAQFLLAFER